MALLAQRAGLSVRVVDKAPAPSPFSRAIGLQYRVSELLALLGLADRFVEAGTKPSRVTMYAGQRPLLSLSFFDFSALTGHNAFVPVSIMIPQSETERLLSEALGERGGRVEWGTELEEFSQARNSISITLRKAGGVREQAEADWLVGCDGAHSIVRKMLGLHFEGKSSPLSFIIADVESSWPSDRGNVHVWLHRDGSAAAMPLPGPERWRLFVETTKRDAGTMLDFGEIRRLVAERADLADVNLGRLLWRSEFSINCRMVDRLRVGRVFVAGDAAHIHSPTGGQGIATGLQDAANLAWKLGQVHRGASSDLLDTYTEERLPHVRHVLDETDRNTNLFVAPTRWLRILRDYIALPLLRTRALQRILVRRLSQLDTTYRVSVLSYHGDGRRWWRGTKIRAGDRAPDFVLVSNSTDGRMSLFSALESGRLISLIGFEYSDARLSALIASLQRLDVLTYAVAPADIGSSVLPCAAFRDEHGELARLYGMTGQYLCIFRPDGHVGLFQRPIKIAPIRNWLGLIYSPSSVRAAFGSLCDDE
jgi:4,5-epoxidase